MKTKVHSAYFRKVFKGDLVNWDKSTFDIINMTIEDQPMKALCIPPRPGHVPFPMRRNFTTHMELCQKMKGITSVVKDEKTRQWMDNEMIKHSAQCGNNIGKFTTYRDVS